MISKTNLDVISNIKNIQAAKKNKILSGNNIETILVALKNLADQFELDLCVSDSTEFSNACINDNSIIDLITALKMHGADEAVCRTWKISPIQWKKAVRYALAVRIWDVITDIEELNK